MISDELMIVVPDDTSMPVDDVRPAVDRQHHRRQRNATRMLVGTLTRRTSLLPPPPAVDHHPAGPLPVQEASPENAAESSVSRVKKKIKQKRTWDDEPEAQASEVLQNATVTSKRPDRIKTRRRLVQVPPSSTTRALRTAASTVPAVVQDDPYYDFGKKIRHVTSSTIGVVVVDGPAVEPDVRTPPKPTKAVTPEDDRDTGGAGADVQAPAAVRIRTMQQQQQQSPSNHRAHPNGPRRSTPTTPSDECVFPRFVRRNNKSRSQRDVVNRCTPGPAPEPDVTRTTRILSTVVTSVSSVVKGGPNQKKNDTLDEVTSSDAADDDYQPTPSSSPGHPKYFRNRYRNITLPEYLEITRVNQRRLNNNSVTTAVTEAATRPTFAKVTTPPGSSTEVTAVASSSSSSSTSLSSSSSSTVNGDSTETLMDGGATTADDNDDDDDSRSLPVDSHPSPSSSSLPPTDLQDFIYLRHNGTSMERSPPVVHTADHTTASEARQRRPPPPPPSRNVTATRPTTEHDVGVVYPDGLAASTYLLTFLAVVPLVLVIAFAFRLAVRRKRKKVFDSSEYSSEYNRSPLDFNTITSSPITTKLPRVPQHIVWDAEKTAAATSSPLPGAVQQQPPPLPPANTRWEFPRDKLRLQTILGQGNFGQVWKAEADDISGHEGLTRLVAVKMVKEDAASREREDLIRELSIMQHLGSHPNVVTLLGCCTEKGELPNNVRHTLQV